MGSGASQDPKPISTSIEALSTKSEHNPGEFEEGQFVNARGRLIHTYRAPAKGKARAAVVAHHGLRVHALFELCTKTEFGGRVNVFPGSIADDLTKLGFEVHALDCEGHGLSESAGGDDYRGYFESIDHLVEDYLHFAKMVKSQTKLPVFGFGESMGAGIVTAAARTTPSPMDGMVLVAPMISVEKIKSKPVNVILLSLAGVVGTMLPRMRIVSMERNPDDDARISFENDPLNDTSPMMRVAPSHACVRFCEDLSEHLAEVQVPFLTLHSRKDTFTDFCSSERLHAEANVKDKTFSVAPEGSCHALLTEAASRDWAREAVTSWLQERAK